MAYWETEDETKVLNPEKIPDWVRYDGKFRVTYKIEKEIPASFENNKSRITFFNQTFHAHLEEIGYKEGFFASYYGPGENEKEYFFDFYCKKELWEKFEGLEKEGFRPYGSYKLDLLVRE